MEPKLVIFNSTRQILATLLILSLALAAFAPFNAQAHNAGQSYVYLTIENQSLTGRIEATSLDLNKALSLNLAEDKSLSLEQVAEHRNAITDYYQAHLKFSVDGQPLPMEFGDASLANVFFGTFVKLEFTLTSPSHHNQQDNSPHPDKILIENNLIFDAVEDHQSLVIIENHWKSGTLENELLSSLTFVDGQRTQTLNVDEGSILQGLWGFIQSGMHHIWIGLDHILFLIALLLPSVMVVKDRRWQPADDLRTVLIRVVTIVTAFTVAHSVTLSIAALDVFTLPSRVVESIIALSIGIAAIHLVRPNWRTHALGVVLAFGLFHGFGFASVLGELRIPEEYLVWSLLGFNIGVELGQLAIVIVVLPVLFLLRNTAFYTRIVLPWGAAALILISAYWLFERVFDVNIPIKAPLRALLGT